MSDRCYSDGDLILAYRTIYPNADITDSRIIEIVNDNQTDWYEGVKELAVDIAKWSK